MKVILGDKGLKFSQQMPFKSEVLCSNCGQSAKIGFVAYEDETTEPPYLCEIQKNVLHDLCSVAVYFCEHCLSITTKFNQG